MSDGSAGGARPTPPARLPTGITGLDTVLRGGLLRGGLYLVVGPSGAGKTILANQACFHQVATGGRAVYLTLLAETHGLLVTHLSSLAFFDPAAVGGALRYYSASTELQQGGLDGLRTSLHAVLRDDRPTLLVLDGLAPVAAAAGSEEALRAFLVALQVQAAARGCTTLLLAAAPAAGTEHPADAAVDGIIALDDRRVGPRAVRELSVRKFRGGDTLRGGHDCAITAAGLVVYPRTEALLATPTREIAARRERRAVGIRGLDAMLHGGVQAGSTTLLLGGSGSGKTLTGLSFLVAGAEAGERGLYVGFYESPARLVSKAEGIGLALGQHVAAGSIALLWQAPTEGSIDALAGQLLEGVRDRGVSRLVIDGLDGFARLTVEPARIARFFTALSNELRALEVTTVVASELPTLFGPSVEVPIAGVSPMVETMLLLRAVELRSQLHRLVSIIKVRESPYDTAIREFRITARGIEVAATFASAEAVLTGLARPIPGPEASSAAPPSHAEPGTGA